MKHLPLTLLFALLMLAVCLRAQTAANSSFADMPTVTYCELISNPSLYDGKVVRLKGIYSRLRDVSEFHDCACEDVQTIWVEFGPTYQSCTKPKVVKLLNRMYKESGLRFDPTTPGRTIVMGYYRRAQVEFVGKFQAFNPYSNSGPDTPVVGSIDQRKNYKHLFRVSYVQQARLLPEKGN